MSDEVKQHYSFGPYQLDTVRRLLLRGGLPVAIPPKAFETLVVLVANKGRIVEKDELLALVWPDTNVEENNLSQCISTLRRVLGEGRDEHRFIVTAPGRGYCFVAGSAEDPGNGSGRGLTGPPQLAAALRRKLNFLAFRTASTAVIAVLICGTAAYVYRPMVAPPKILGYTQITHDGQQKSFQGQLTTNLLTDGPRLYVQENVSGHFVVAQVPANGGETLPVSTELPNVVLENLSADKSELLLGSFRTGGEAELSQWAMPTTGGTTRFLGSGGDAVWMPNGDLLVSRQYELQIVSKNGGTRKFASTNGLPYWFRWSPDGKILRFTTAETGKGPSIWEVSSEGGTPHRLFPDWKDPSVESQGNWTPDGNYFVFQVYRNGRLDIWAVREKSDWFHKASREPVQLTSGPLNFHSPQPSTDGKKIFVVGEQVRAELERYDPKSHRFVPYLGGISAGELSFSPDGQWIAYVSYPDKVLWRSRADGSEKLRLTSASQRVAFPRWSPNGTEIVFVCFQEGEKPALAVIHRDGGSPRTVYTSRNALDRPSWMPDGSVIAFGEWKDPDAKDAVVKLLDLKSLRVKSLSGTTGLWFPLLSPDGRYLAATSAETLKPILFDFTTEKRSELANLSVGVIEWSIDGKAIYFDSGLSENPAVSRLGIANRKLERIVGLEDFRRVVSGFVSWSGVTPNGDPLLMRDTGTQEVYALDFQAP
jgi:Tol biopolymer transport system component/DNA-binding winged helix-turn-helix (wHTH) protein